jgi:hypothetical protein
MLLHDIFADEEYVVCPRSEHRNGSRLALFNDTQDQDFLHTFALLPQSVYPTDVRDATIANPGGDIHGRISLGRRFGDLAYTAFAGHRNDSIRSGYPYLLSQYQTLFKRFSVLQYGMDLRWETPVKGLLVGISRMNDDTSGAGTSVDPVNPLSAACLTPNTREPTGPTSFTANTASAACNSIPSSATICAIR